MAGERRNKIDTVKLPSKDYHMLTTKRRERDYMVYLYPSRHLQYTSLHKDLC